MGDLRALLVALLIATSVLAWSSGRRCTGRTAWSALSAPAAPAALSAPAALARCRFVRGRSRRLGREPTSRVATILDVAVAGDLLALALDSGAGVDECLEAVAKRSGGLTSAHLATVAAGRRWGLSDETAWALVDPAWVGVARALHLASLAGVPPGRLLTAAAADLRAAEQHRVELAVSRLRVAVVLPLGACFLPAFVLTTILPVILALAGRTLAL